MKSSNAKKQYLRNDYGKITKGPGKGKIVRVLDHIHPGQPLYPECNLIVIGKKGEKLSVNSDNLKPLPQHLGYGSA